MLKVLILIASVVMEQCLAITDNQKTQIQTKFVEVGSECIKDYPLTVADLESFRTRVLPDSDNAGCFSACVFKKVGIFDDKGVLSHATALENAKKVFEDEDELKNIELFLTTCAKVNDEEVTDGELGCERAKLAFNCFAENYEKFGINIDF